jgi:hypothetical protein
LPIFSGGGAITLSALLEGRIVAAQREVDSYRIVPVNVASTLNAVGLFALALYTAQRGGR